MPPSISMRTPLTSQTVSGGLAGSSCEAVARDNKAVGSVAFAVDGKTLSTDTAAPWNCSWDTTAWADGEHVLSARARDASGNSATAWVKVTVENAAMRSADNPAQAPSPAPSPPTTPAPAPSPSPPPSTGTFAHQSVALAAWGGLDYFRFPSDVGFRNIDEIVAMGANTIDLQTMNETNRSTDTVANDLAEPTNATAIRSAVAYAMDKGLKVTLKPHSGTLASHDYYPDDPIRFWNSYERMILAHADIAAQTGVAMLVIGTELGGKLSSNQYGNHDNCTRWRGIIDQVRARAPQVKLTYAATMTNTWNYLESNEATRVCFWKQLDYIGFDAYPDMNHIAADATGDDFERRMFDNGNPISAGGDDGTADPIFDLDRFANRYGLTNQSHVDYIDFVADGIRRLTGRPEMKVILTEIGAPSTNDALGYWGLYGDRTINNTAQANAWEGAMRALSGRTGLAGMVVWSVSPWHGAEDTISPSYTTDYDPTGKPAERVICRWFSARSGRDC